MQLIYRHNVYIKSALQIQTIEPKKQNKCYLITQKTIET